MRTVLDTAVCTNLSICSQVGRRQGCGTAEQVAQRHWMRGRPPCEHRREPAPAVERHKAHCALLQPHPRRAQRPPASPGTPVGCCPLRNTATCRPAWVAGRRDRTSTDRVERWDSGVAPQQREITLTVMNQSIRARPQHRPGPCDCTSVRCLAPHLRSSFKRRPRIPGQCC